MRLTKAQKEAFVRGVMQDVPRVDNEDQIRKLLCDEVRKSALPEINHLAESYENLFQTGFAEVAVSPRRKGEFSTYRQTQHLQVQLPPHQELWRNWYTMSALAEEGIISQALKEQLEVLYTEHQLNKEVRESLEVKLINSIANCTTDKQLKELYPEFAKYVPGEEPKTGNLPALANIVTDFVKAGWPKDKEESK